MNAFLCWPVQRLNSICQLTLAFMIVTPLSVANAADARLVAMVKGAAYQQTSATSLIPLPGETYWFSALVVAENSGAIIDARVRLPNGTFVTLEPSGEQWEREDTFLEVASLNTTFPDSATNPYELHFTGINDGTQWALLQMTGALFPNAPRLGNFAAAQAIDATSDFTLQWEPMVGGVTEDAIVVNIARASDEQVVFSSGLPGEAGALTGSATIVKVPAGTLEEGSIYDLSIIFLKVIDSKSVAGVKALAGYAAETTARIVTAGGSSSSSLRFSFFAGEGILSLASSGTIVPGYRWPVRGRYSLQCVVDDSGDRPQTVTFTSPPDGGFQAVASVVYWDFMGPTIRIYGSTELDVPPYPPAGSYFVDYKNRSLAFVKKQPDVEAAQVLIRPSIDLTSGKFRRVNWSYVDLRGQLVSAPSAFSNLTLRIESDTGQLFHEDNLAIEPSTKLLPAQLTWSQVRRVTFIARDYEGNLFQSPSVRWDHPQVLSCALPDAEMGKAYSTTLQGAGGRLPYSWSYVGGDPMPPGLQLSSQGVISGQAQTAGRHYLDVRLRDGNGQETLGTVVVLVVEPGSPALRHYRLDHEQVFQQKSTDRSDFDPIPAQAGFSAQVYGISAASVTHAEFICPTSVTYPLVRSFCQDVNLAYSEVFGDLGRLYVKFPVASGYRLRLTTDREGAREVLLDAEPPDYPAAPMISNWADLQFCEVAGAMFVYWEPWLGATTNDFIYVELQEADTGQRRSSSVPPPLPYSLHGLRTGVGFGLDSLYPPLEPGRAYRVQVTFTRPVDFRSAEANTNYPGVLGMSGFSTSTRAIIVTKMDYGVWRDRVFSVEQLEHPDIVDPSGDPDDDGFVNRVEYAMGWSPLVADDSRLLSVSARGAEVTLIHSRQAGAGGVEVEVETATQLDKPDSWVPLTQVVPAAALRVDWLATDDSLRRMVRTRIDARLMDGPRFFRLRVR